METYTRDVSFVHANPSVLEVTMRDGNFRIPSEIFLKEIRVLEVTMRDGNERTIYLQ